MVKKLAICVPYRDREEHLKEFVPKVTKFLKQQNIEHKIFICHQVDDKSFNRGKLKNIAFEIACKEGFDYFAFHDIDLIPEDESCDYSFPISAPVQVSKYLSRSNYEPLYPTNFGGVVLFSKEQFENINGYYNDYWEWGAEDDDLFWRCKKTGYSDLIHSVKGYRNNYTAKFNGKDSRIIVKQSREMQNLLTNDCTIIAMVKPETREDIPYKLSGDETVPYLQMPILTRYGLNLISYTNTRAYVTNLISDNNKDNDCWSHVDPEIWATVGYHHEKENLLLKNFINGKTGFAGSITKYESSVKEYYGAPFFIGFNDYPTWFCEGQNTFKGSIAFIGMWNRALTAEEHRKVAADYKNIPKDGLVLHYDFSNVDNEIIKDQSGHGNNGIMKNIEIERTDIGDVIEYDLPHKREGRFLCLPHESEGHDEQGKFKQKGSSRNESILVNEVKTGKINFKEHGLNNLDYELVNIEGIYNEHAMINVRV